MTIPSDPRGSIVESQRPWGGFQQFTANEETTVKIIAVDPGCRLSLQTHEHRAELWQVLDGPLDITVGEDAWTARAGDRVWVPRGVAHRVGNSGDAPGRLLEIGYGEFDEDDIVRIEDDYQR